MNNFYVWPILEHFKEVVNIAIDGGHLPAVSTSYMLPV